MIRVGIDFHGVLDIYKNLFKTILPLIRKAGDLEIHIITGPPLIEAMSEVKSTGYVKGKHFDFLHTVVEYLDVTGHKIWQDDKGNWWAKDDDWWSTKANICKYYNIDFMLDDSEKYAPYFVGKTKFIHIDQLKRRIAKKKNV
jgi:hypothetical protein